MAIIEAIIGTIGIGFSKLLGLLALMQSIPAMLKPLVASVLIYFLGYALLGSFFELMEFDPAWAVLGMEWNELVWLLILGIMILGYLGVILKWYGFWGLDKPTV